MRGLPPKTNPLRVAVQGDAALVHALSDSSSWLILSPVETSLEISARVTQADVLLVDVTHDTAHALEAIRGLQLDRPVLALATKDLARDARAAGATGVLDRASPPEVIEAALWAMEKGVAVHSPGFLEGGAPSSPVVVRQPREKGSAVLTARENEVIGLLADGFSNKEIAQKLTISEHTAKFHVNSILQKMGAQKRVEAVVRAAKMGLIEI